MSAAARSLIALLLPAALFAQDQPAQPFPHARHARFFPTCVGCHAGVTAGDAARTFPSTAVCANCHDGTIRSRVAWTPPPPRGAGLLAFSHATHLSSAADVGCVRCHAVDTTAWMNVARPVQDTCRGCHQHSAPAHLDDANKCATCHRPLAAATALTEARILSLPRPPSHALPDWIGGRHGPVASMPSANCATCHARESCMRCHVNATTQPVIRALPSDARVARTVAGRAPSYPTPSTHHTANFTLTHAAAARAEPMYCANCHARSSCETCHTGNGASDILRQLPDARSATAPGVQLRRAPASPAASPVVPAPRGLAALAAQPHARDTVTRRVRVHPAGFDRAHGPAAAAGELNCTGCHGQSFCANCHAAERNTRRYHPADFLATHAPQAYAREVDCAGCHSTQVFCRSCHLQSGIAPRASSQRSTTYHNGTSQWLLQHGRAARQDLPSCTACHQQTYCMQCHSDNGSRINPHGPGFDAERMRSRNPQLCLRCHLNQPPK